MKWMVSGDKWAVRGDSWIADCVGHGVGNGHGSQPPFRLQCTSSIY